MKFCKGCGEILQDKDKNNSGYIVKMENDFCLRCFRIKNYGEISNDFENFNIEFWLKEVSKHNNKVMMIIDVMDPVGTMVKDINKYVKSKDLTLVVNKVDLLPKSISKEKIIDWIYDISLKLKIEFSQIVLASSTKKINIDAISDYIISLEDNISFIGYSNVGKSSLINALFASTNLKTLNLVSNSIGTTKKTIENVFKNNFSIIDYPGFIKRDSFQFNLSPSDLKLVNSKKEIKVINYQLEDKQTIEILENKCYFEVEKSKNKNGYQFLFSNSLELSRHKNSFLKEKINDLQKKEITPLKNTKRQDIIISGLGIITFKNLNQKLNIYLPKNINVYVVESLFEER